MAESANEVSGKTVARVVVEYSTLAQFDTVAFYSLDSRSGSLTLTFLIPAG